MHHHNHHSQHHHDHGHSSDRIKRAFLQNFFFALIEVAGGFFTGSFAVLAGALHDLGDSLAIGVAWALESFSLKKPSAEFTYGYKRFSLLSALISGIITGTGSIFIAKNAFDRIHNMTLATNSQTWGMLGLAILGAAVNGFAALRLSKGKTQNEKVLSWHLMEDTLGWVAIVIGSILIFIFKWTWIDPALAIAISLVILWNIVRNLSHTVSLFLQSTPKNIDLGQLREQIQTLGDVVSLHDFHLWSLDGEKHILSLHIIVKDIFSEQQKLKSQIRELIKKYGNIHSTIEIETESEACIDNCD